MFVKGNNDHNKQVNIKVLNTTLYLLQIKFKIELPSSAARRGPTILIHECKAQLDYPQKIYIASVKNKHIQY